MAMIVARVGSNHSSANALLALVKRMAAADSLSLRL